MSVEEDVGDTLLRTILKLLCPELLLRDILSELFRLSSPLLPVAIFFDSFDRFSDVDIPSPE